MFFFTRYGPVLLLGLYFIPFTVAFVIWEVLHTICESRFHLEAHAKLCQKQNHLLLPRKDDNNSTRFSTLLSSFLTEHHGQKSPFVKIRNL